MVTAGDHVLNVKLAAAVVRFVNSLVIGRVGALGSAPIVSLDLVFRLEAVDFADILININ